MKKKHVIFAVGAILILGLVAAKTVLTTHESQYKPRTATSLAEEKGYRGAAEWMMQRKAGMDGEIRIENVEKARKAVAAMRGKKSANSVDFDWEEMGPDNIAGRTRAIIYDMNNPNILYAGAISGGLWRSTSGGVSWNKITYVGADETEFGTLNVSCITQGADGAIYFGTGESFAGSSINNYGVGQGAGIWKSTDGLNFTRLESTWIPSNQTTFNYINRLAADPVDANRIYAATHRGLHYTDDAGISWNKIAALSIANQSRNTDDVKVGSDGTIVASIENRTFIAPEGDLSQIYSPFGSPNVPSGRLEFAIAPSDPNYIYCHAAKPNGTLENIYQSTDKGETWTVIGPGGFTTFQTLGNQGIYDNCIAVYPDDPETIITGGQYALWKWSPNTEWSVLTSWSLSPGHPLFVHADHHVFAFHPNYGQNGNQTMIVGTDGGFYKSDYAGLYWIDLNKNFATIQFYKIDTDGAGRVMGGTQDNGTLYNDFGGNTIRNFYEVLGGDGGQTKMSRLNSDVAFATVYYGSLRRTEEKGASFYETGRYFYNNTIVNKYWGGIEGNIASTSYPVAPFVTLFDLWESFNDPNSIDSVNYNNKPLLIPLLEYDNYIATIDAQYSNYSLDTSMFLNVNGEMMVEVGIIFHTGETLIVPSSIANRPLYQELTEDLNPGDSIKVQDTYQSMIAVPLFDRFNNLYNIWVTRKPLNFNVLAAFQPWAPILPNGGISAGGSWAMREIKFSQDGNFLFFALNNSLYRVSGFNNARLVNQLHGDSTNTNQLSWTAIQSFPNSINGISIDPNNSDRVLVTLAGSTTSNVYFSSNATSGNPSFTSKRGNLPLMPAFSGIINWQDGNQVMIGTEFGVFTTENISAISVVWENQYNEYLSNAVAMDLVQQVFENYQYGVNNHEGIENHGWVYVGTHGRGIFRSDAWKGPLSTPKPIESKPFSLIELNVFPNPVKDIATVNYTLSVSAAVEFKVFDINGRLVHDKSLSNMPAGNHEIRFDMSQLQKGTYILNMYSGYRKLSKKMIVL